eukprot:7268-Heterococcus_DN1.PRE.3
MEQHSSARKVPSRLHSSYLQSNHHTKPGCKQQLLRAAGVMLCSQHKHKALDLELHSIEQYSSSSTPLQSSSRAECSLEQPGSNMQRSRPSFMINVQRVSALLLCIMIKAIEAVMLCYLVQGSSVKKPAFQARAAASAKAPVPGARNE